MRSHLRPERAVAARPRTGLARLAPFALLAACGGGGGGGHAVPATYEIVVHPPEPIVAASVVELSGSATCDTCPPSETALGTCPPIQVGIPSAIDVSWSNVTNGASGSALHGVSGQCGCLFSYCTVVYAHRWLASVPLAMGPNEIVVAALGADRDPGTATVLVTRVPHAPTNLVAVAEHGAITLTWDPAADAERYDLLESTSPDLAGAQRIAEVTSPYRREGVPDDATRWYAVVSRTNDWESAPSETAWATGGWRVEDLPSSSSTWVPSAIALAIDPLEVAHVVASRHESLNPPWTFHDEYLNDANGTWTSATIGPSQNGDANVAVDDAGVVHLGWVSAGMIHATIAGASTTTEAIPDLGSCRSSLALDAHGGVHVVSTWVEWDGTAWRSTLRTATNATGVWTATTVEATDLGCGYPGVAPRIAVDANGVEHVAWIGAAPAYGLLHAEKSNGAWSRTTLAPGSPRGIALALDAEGSPYVLYSNAAAELHLARRVASAWTDERVDAAQAAAPSLVVDAAGNAHASYVVAGGELRYATNAAGSWRFVRVASDAGSYDDRTTAIALDPQERVHVAAFGPRGPRHATNR